MRRIGRSKQAYYKQLHHKADTTVKEETIVGLIKKKREIWKRGSGRNLHQCLLPELKQHNIKIGRDKFLMCSGTTNCSSNQNDAERKPLVVIIISTDIKI
ncbi:MAG: hypothetical protein IPH58_17940 [Sphingobacteriales bacterium]|nr:hypothetical protein [Sphingobacteriales bacterium]